MGVRSGGRGGEDSHVCGAHAVPSASQHGGFSAITMSSRGGASQSLAALFALVGLSLSGGPMALAAVDLEWRPSRQAADVGEVVEIDLYAVARSGSDEPVFAIRAVLSWDELALELLGLADPCEALPCPPNTYAWVESDFPYDAPDGLNDTWHDGDAMYRAFGQFAPEERAVATGNGLWVTTFRFRTLRSGTGELRLEEQLGESARTQVVAAPGVDVTGVLGLPAEVVIGGCAAPLVSPIGSRYLAVTPVEGGDLLALRVEGAADYPAVACVSRYVQLDGTLGPTRVTLRPVEWGTVYIADIQIRPSTTYQVQAICIPEVGPGVLSSPVSATTWLWGDVNNDGVAYIEDVLMVTDGSLGLFGPDTILENLDLSPCVPDGEIDDQDIASAQAAYAGDTFSCVEPCQPGTGLDEFADFVPCMAGPATDASDGCGQFDSDLDNDLDLVDFAAFQTLFAE